MSWFEKRRWSRQRAEEERQALAASVEELTTGEHAQGGAWSEEEEEEEGMSGPAIIPPKLRLQSRSLPVVRLETTQHMPVGSEVTREHREGQRVLAEQVRGTSKRLGRSTRVRLQAVLPGQESAVEREPTTERVPVLDRAEEGEKTRTGDRTREDAPEHERSKLVRRLEPSEVGSAVSAPSALLCGSGVIEAGQEDATIHNARISAQSVVSVMLAGNPGPVVVHYISLQPRAGFTLHMSAPVSSTTPFTYAVWLF